MYRQFYTLFALLLALPLTHSVPLLAHVDSAREETTVALGSVRFVKRTGRSAKQQSPRFNASMKVTDSCQNHNNSACVPSYPSPTAHTSTPSSLSPVDPAPTITDRAIHPSTAETTSFFVQQLSITAASATAQAGVQHDRRQIDPLVSAASSAAGSAASPPASSASSISAISPRRCKASQPSVPSAVSTSQVIVTTSAVTSGAVITTTVVSTNTVFSAITSLPASTPADSDSESCDGFQQDPHLKPTCTPSLARF